MDDTFTLIRKAREGDRSARDAVISRNMGLVWSIVRRFGGRGHELEDLAQIGSIGLMKAIDKFDLDYGVQFSTYAMPLITGEIKRFLRDDGMIKVSRTLKETALRVRLAREKLGVSFGREPTIEEISSELAITVEDIILAEESVCEVESLHKTIYQSDGHAIELMDKIESGKDEQAAIIDHLALHEIMDTLEEKEQRLIHMRYFDEKTQTEIAGEMGISQVQVSRLEKKILLRMRKALI